MLGQVGVYLIAGDRYGVSVVTNLAVVASGSQAWSVRNQNKDQGKRN
jgi:hypothetical protein